jgi:hypothetical protein
MATKTSLLYESQRVLQDHLGASLLEDQALNQKKKKRQSTLPLVEKNLISIIGSPDSAAAEPAEDRNNAATAAANTKNKAKLIKCQGWVRENRIWIQAQALVL